MNKYNACVLPKPDLTHKEQFRSNMVSQPESENRVYVRRKHNLVLTYFNHKHQSRKAPTNFNPTLQNFQITENI